MASILKIITVYYNYNFNALLDTPKTNNHMLTSLADVDYNMYPSVARNEFQAGIEGFDTCNILYTDGSLIDGKGGFAVYHSEVCKIGFHLNNPTSVFTAEVYAIYFALYHISLEAPGAYMIVTDRLHVIICHLQR
jgi:hypothetical protein